MDTGRTYTCRQVQALATIPQGLGTSLAPRPSASRSSCNRKLLRQWTRCKHGASVATAALPFPFMELSVSVVDTLDMLRSSVEEEIVFQATMQVPAHHAIACRIEAYDTPFVAPALAADPSHLSENDKQFAACLASPPDLEEAPSFVLSRTASMFQQQRPELRTATSLLTVSFSIRQRNQNNKKQDALPGDDDSTPLPPDQEQPSSDLGRDGFLMRMSSVHNSSYKQERGLSAARTAAIAKAAVALVSQDAAGSVDDDDEAFTRALSQIQARGLVRLESMSRDAARHRHEVAPISLHAPISCGLTSVMGLAAFLLHFCSTRLQARTEPATSLKSHVLADVA